MQLRRDRLAKLVIAVSSGVVDIPSQMHDATNAQVAQVRGVYTGNLLDDNLVALRPHLTYFMMHGDGLTPSAWRRSPPQCQPIS